MDFNTPVVFKKTYRTMPCLTSPVSHIQSNIFGPMEVTQTGHEFAVSFRCLALDPFNEDEDGRWMEASNTLKPEAMLQISLWFINHGMTPLFSLNSLLTDKSKIDWRAWCLARFSTWIDVYNDQVMSGKKEEEFPVPHQFVKDMCALSYFQYLAVKGEVILPFDLVYLRFLKEAIHQKFGPGIEGERLSRFKEEIEERASVITGFATFDITSPPGVWLDNYAQKSGSEIWREMEDVGTELLKKVIKFFGSQKADEDAFYEKTNRLVLKDLYVELMHIESDSPHIPDQCEVLLRKGYCPHSMFVNELDKLPAVVKTEALGGYILISGARRVQAVSEAKQMAKERQVKLRFHESFLDAYPRYKEMVDENGFYKEQETGSD